MPDTATNRDPIISDHAKYNLLGFGEVSTLSEAEVFLKNACHFSAPITHESGDFRYMDYVLDIQEGVLLGVYEL